MRLKTDTGDAHAVGICLCSWMGTFVRVAREWLCSFTPSDKFRIFQFPAVEKGGLEIATCGTSAEEETAKKYII